MHPYFHHLFLFVLGWNLIVPDSGEPPVSAAHTTMEPVILVQFGAVDVLEVKANRRVGRAAGGTDDLLGGVEEVAEFAAVARPVARGLEEFGEVIMGVTALVARQDPF